MCYRIWCVNQFTLKPADGKLAFAAVPAHQLKYRSYQQRFALKAFEKKQKQATGKKQKAKSNIIIYPCIYAVKPH